jgi:ribulose-5-phosphate 4-epimerase/fuculose-1-phosphate aldolase
MRKKIVNDLGQSKIMILRNHGAAFCGSSIEEVWFWVETFMTAADIQLRALSAANGNIKENICVPPDHVLTQVQNVLKKGVNEKPADGISWQIGEMEFEGEMRRLDSLVKNIKT